MLVFKTTYKPFGNKAILIEWPQEISEEILQDILSFKNKIQLHYTGFYDITTAYNSLTIYLNSIIINFDNEIISLNKIYSYNVEKTKYKKNFTWRIPACYHSDLAPDLESFLELKNLTLSKLIDLHSRTIYTVYFLGFLPGFPYLGGLSNQLHLKRKTAPDLNIKKGAIGIGGQQTGVYTVDSPGGWHIIAKTPINFFDINKEPPCFIKAGDKIIFDPISKSTYNSIAKQILNDTYKIKKQNLYV